MFSTKALPDNILCRQNQAEQTAIFLDPNLPNVPTVVVYGQEATGKTLVITQLLARISLPWAIVDSRECITGRHLLERTVAICKGRLEEADYGPFNDIDGRCESLSALAFQLHRLLDRCPRFYLAFDAVDTQREAPTTLLPALARLGEIIPNLTTIFIVSHPSPLFLHKAGIPHIGFPPYTKSESLEIVGQDPLPIYSPETAIDPNADSVQQQQRSDDDAWLWYRYCGLLWDSLGRGAARDVANFRSLCIKQWLPFVQPIREGVLGPRELSKLVNRTRTLFQNEDALRENIVPSSSAQMTDDRRRSFKNSQELSYYTKYLLIAAYLCSHNPPRTDAIFFMKMHEKKKKKTKKTVADSAAAAAAGAMSASRPMKHRKVQRRLLGAQPFVLERLLAVFHAVLPHAGPSGRADILVQVATLTSLKLLVKTVGGADVLDPSTKFRVNVGWDYIIGLARTLRFELEEFVVD